MGGYKKFAEREFDLLLRRNGSKDKLDRQRDEMLRDNVLDLLEVLGDQGHSGGSIREVLGLFRKCALFQPLTPLSGEDSEWAEVTAEGSKERLWQNVRCPHVFKEEEGGAFDVDAVVFETPGGAQYTSSNSRRYITFPYTPTQEVLPSLEDE